MQTRTAAQFVAAAKSVIGCKYWYACSGEKPTSALLDYKIQQFPKMWTPGRILKAQAEIGVSDHVFDCIGLVRWCAGMNKDKNALLTNPDKLHTLSPGGKIAELPEILGILVFCRGHVGIYTGNERVIECWGFRQVDDRPLGSQTWAHWGYCPWVEYPQEKQQEVSDKLHVGDRVQVIRDIEEYYPGLRMPEWLPGQQFQVAQILYRGKEVVKGGKTCVLLNRINTWCAVENLSKVQD